jgi:ketosteroid isomerase-like protein
MSRENVEIVRLGYEAFNRGDVDRILDMCDPDVEWEDIPSLDIPAAVGKDAVRAYFEAVMAAWERVRREPEEVIDLGGERVLVLCHVTARGRGSGIEVDGRIGDLLTFRDGRVVCWTSYASWARARKAAGLLE